MDPGSGTISKWWNSSPQAFDRARETKIFPTTRTTQEENTTRDDKTKEEILPENRSRQGPEKGANPDGSGRRKIPGFGGRQTLRTFQLKSYSKCDDFGPQQARGPSGGFSGGRDETSGGTSGETSKTIKDTMQEHSFITSLFCLVVFRSLSFGCSS